MGFNVLCLKILNMIYVDVEISARKLITRLVDDQFEIGCTHSLTNDIFQYVFTVS